MSQASGSIPGWPTDRCIPVPLRLALQAEPKNGVSNHEIHETHEKGTTYNAVSVHPAGERPALLAPCHFVCFVYFVVSTAVFRFWQPVPSSALSVFSVQSVAYGLPKFVVACGQLPRLQKGELCRLGFWGYRVSSSERFSVFPVLSAFRLSSQELRSTA